MYLLPLLILLLNEKKILNNKFTFFTTNKNPRNEFMSTISKIFDFKYFKNINVFGDACSWILVCENIIIPCLCEFHVKQKTNCSIKDESLRK